MRGEILTLNETFKVRAGRLRKNGSRGKDRVTIEVESEPVVGIFDDRVLGSGPATALADQLRSELASISERASDATIRYRTSARKAFRSGKRWATKRYSGGRTGSTPPGDGDRVFNDSGRFAQTIVARLNRTDSSFTVNVAANRLDNSTFNDLSFRRMTERLRGFLPSLDPRKAARTPRMRSAISESTALLLQKSRNEVDAKRKQLRAVQLQTLATVGRVVVGAL